MIQCNIKALKAEYRGALCEFDGGESVWLTVGHDVDFSTLKKGMAMIERNGKFMNAYMSVDKPNAVPQPIVCAVQPDIQRLIVRQSCLKAAVDLLKEGHYDIDTSEVPAYVPNSKTVLKVAEEFEDWVYR